VIDELKLEPPPSFRPETSNYASTSFPSPRDFQVSAHEKLRAGVRRGHKKQLLVAPTGSGKTYLGLRVAHESLIKGRRALFVCDRTALINQTSERADAYGLTAHGIVQANHWRRDNAKPFQIASIQTISARGYWPEADVIIIDEAHTQYKAWVEHLQKTEAAVIGLTATPCSRGLGLSFTNMVNAATMHELTESGVLVPLRILSCTRPDMTGAETSGGEWTDRAAAERETHIIGDVVAEWAKHGEGRKTIAFGADIAYCTELAQRFNQAGIVADTFTSETSATEREYLLKEFRKPDSKIRILVSVEALAKGFDVQDIGCVIDARPLRKSLSTAIQMWGRGLRSSKETGKTDCLLLDHSGNIIRFLKDYTDVFFNGFQSLDMSEKLDATVRDEKDFTPAGCPGCGYKPFHRRCMSCGFEKPTLALEDSSAGEMREIRIGKTVIASDGYDLWRQLCAYARGSSKPEKQPGRAWHLYQDITGEKPPRAWVFDSTANAPVTRGTLNKIKSLRIAFIKGRRT
jgi:superfamily II DNA or RNA helicase